MNATCQITQVMGDRIRLHVSGISTQPETSQFLVQFLLCLPGVTGVEIRPASASVVILYDSAPSTREALLQALRGKPLQGGAVEDEAGTTGPSSRAVALPYANCEILHAMRGRVRLRIPVLRTRATLAGVLAHFLGRQAGIKDVRISRLAESIVVHYDPVVWDANSLVTTIAAYDPSVEEIERWRSTQSAQPLQTHNHRNTQKLSVALAISALVLNLLAGAAATPLVFALLLGSSWAMLRGAYKSLFKDRRLSLDTLYATAIVLLCLSGMVWQTALLIALLSAIPWIRSNMQRREKQVISVRVHDSVLGGNAPGDQPSQIGEFVPVEKAEHDGDRPGVQHRRVRLAVRRARLVSGAPDLPGYRENCHRERSSNSATQQPRI